MDRLEKALAKVKKEDDKAQRKSTIENDIHPLAINYTHTKSRALDYEKLRQRKVVAFENHSNVSEVFRILRTKILQQLRTNNWNSFAITSPREGAGKSLISANLAIAIAKEANQTVLLVDLDLKFPKLHWYFDITPEKGLNEYLTTDIPLNEILINPGVEKLVILPGKGEKMGRSELLSTPKMLTMVQEIKQRYQSRIIIFDLPPILVSDDVLVCLDFFDAALLVVEEGGSIAAEVTKSLQLLSGTNLLGTVLNKAELLSKQYEYH